MGNIVDNIVELHDAYIGSKGETWLRRMTWCGLNGKEPKHTTSIAKFNRETNAFATMEFATDSQGFYKAVSKMADKYVEWVRTKGRNYSEIEYADMRNFFVGAIGELFFATIFDEVKCVFAPDRNGEYRRYDFDLVSPTLKGEVDLGVDFHGLVNDNPSVIQSKFWNPYNKKNALGVAVVQKAYAEGVSKEIIDKDAKENVVICTLGAESTVHGYLKKARAYQDNVVVVGRDALSATVDNRLVFTFWKRLYKTLVDFK